MLILHGTIDSQHMHNCIKPVDIRLAVREAYGIDAIIKKEIVFRNFNNFIVDELWKAKSKSTFYRDCSKHIALSAGSFNELLDMLVDYNQEYYLVTELVFNSNYNLITMHNIDNLNLTGEAQAYIRNLLIDSYLAS